MSDLNGKAVLVHGGSSGIGLGTVRVLTAAGARVIVASNDAAALEALEAEGLATLACDVTDEASVVAATRAAVDRLGALHGMVYSAGIQRYGTVTSTLTETWDECLAVNLRGAFLAGKYAVPAIAASGGGAIVNVSSVQGFACQPGVAAYAASKGGLNALTRAMALDHARQGVRVNVVCPGSVDTPMLRASAEEFAQGGDVEAVLRDWGSTHALGRIGAPTEIGAAIAFLLSDAASFVTGAEMLVDGGLLAALPVKLD